MTFLPPSLTPTLLPSVSPSLEKGAFLWPAGISCNFWVSAVQTVKETLDDSITFHHSTCTELCFGAYESNPTLRVVWLKAKSTNLYSWKWNPSRPSLRPRPCITPPSLMASESEGVSWWFAVVDFSLCYKAPCYTVTMTGEYLRCLYSFVPRCLLVNECTDGKYTSYTVAHLNHELGNVVWRPVQQDPWRPLGPHAHAKCFSASCCTPPSLPVIYEHVLGHPFSCKLFD